MFCIIKFVKVCNSHYYDITTIYGEKGRYKLRIKMGILLICVLIIVFEHGI